MLSNNQEEGRGNHQQPPQNGGFTDEQRAELTALIAQTVAATLAAQQPAANGQGPTGPQGERGPPGEPGATGGGGSNGPTTFQAKDIGYFEPQANSSKDVIVKDRDMIYRNVFSFTN